jgi:hypothetical protein
MNNKTVDKYKFDKKLCDLLNITHTDYYTIDDMINRIIPNIFKNKPKFKINNIELAKYFNFSTNNFIWLNDIKNILQDKIIDKDCNFINKYVIIGHDISNVDNLTVDLY